MIRESIDDVIRRVRAANLEPYRRELEQHKLPGTDSLATCLCLVAELQRWRGPCQPIHLPMRLVARVVFNDAICKRESHLLVEQLVDAGIIECLAGVCHETHSAGTYTFPRIVNMMFSERRAVSDQMSPQEELASAPPNDRRQRDMRRRFPHDDDKWV